MCRAGGPGLRGPDHTPTGIRTGVITSEIATRLSIILGPPRGGGMAVGGSVALIDRPQPEQLDISRDDIAEDGFSGSFRKIVLKNPRGSHT